MNDSNLPRHTDGELALLRVLWDLGPSTVQQVHDELSRRDESRMHAYTTTLKLLQIMHAKGLVIRDAAGRAHIYQSTQTKEDAQRSLVGDLLDRAFGGSAQNLVMQALSARRSSPAELAEIRKMLDDLEEGSDAR